MHERQLPLAGTGAGREKNRKYAANLGLVDHTELRQRNYLQFLCLKTVVWSGVPEFAAYFRIGIAEVRGKTEICRADPGFTPPRPAVLLPKIAVYSVVSDFSPHFRLSGISGAICDAEEQCSRQEQRKEYGDSVAIDGFGKFGWGTVAPS